MAIASLEAHAASLADGSTLLSGPAPACAPMQPDRAALQTALDLSGEAVMICSCATQPPRILYVNASFERLTGYSPADIQGQPYDHGLSDALDDSAARSMRDAVRAGRAATLAICYAHKSGAKLQFELAAAPIRSAFGRISYYVMALREATRTQHHVEQLRFMANHDSLTGLPNRRLLLDRIDQALTRYRRNGEAFTIAFVDLNELKPVNDQFGHMAGDELLKHVSRCLTASVRACDTVARYGGDEFVVLLTAAADSNVASHTIARTLLCFEQPLSIDGRLFRPKCSIGIAVCPRDGLDAATLLQAADDAMYLAKSAGRATSSVRGF